MITVTLLKPVASPWGTVSAGGEIDVPAEIAAVWVAEGVAASIAAPTDAPDEKIASAEANTPKRKAR